MEPHLKIQNIFGIIGYSSLLGLDNGDDVITFYRNGNSFLEFSILRKTSYKIYRLHSLPFLV